MAAGTATGEGSRESCLGTMDIACSRDDEGVNCSNSREGRKGEN